MRPRSRRSRPAGCARYLASGSIECENPIPAPLKAVTCLRPSAAGRSGGSNVKVVRRDGLDAVLAEQIAYYRPRLAYTGQNRAVTTARTEGRQMLLGGQRALHSASVAAHQIGAGG